MASFLLVSHDRANLTAICLDLVLITPDIGDMRSLTRLRRGYYLFVATLREGGFKPAGCPAFRSRGIDRSGTCNLPSPSCLSRAVFQLSDPTSQLLGCKVNRL